MEKGGKVETTILSISVIMISSIQLISFMDVKYIRLFLMSSKERINRMIVELIVII